MAERDNEKKKPRERPMDEGREHFMQPDSAIELLDEDGNPMAPPAPRKRP